jgi:putative Mn2+ efflux pump MntP
MTLSPRETAEKAARYRFIAMNFARVGGLVMVLIGIVLARSAPHLSAQWIAGAVLAVLGLLEFFFLPVIIARRFKALDRLRDNRRR